MKTTDYEGIFRHRGASYDRAMRDFPGSRRKEFQALFERLPVRGRERILDFPALGGYLEENLNTPVEVESLDFCPQNEKVKKFSEVSRIKFNRVVNLASFHHVNDPKEFLSEVVPYLEEGGYFHLADVGFSGPIRNFLDEFVNEWTSTGHKGIWRTSEEIVSHGFESGLNLLHAEERDCPWVFNAVSDMLTFCKLLFGLDLSPSDKCLLDALSDYVGIEFSRESGNCELRWRLTYIDLIKNV
jgi:hypothetical protein